MAGLWNKLKKSLALKTSPTPQPSESASSDQTSQMSVNGIHNYDSRSTVTRSASSLSLFSRSFSTRSSKKTCAICLAQMKTGRGQAIFTAECSHTFHFSCIANSVKHGNHLCPICRSKWKDIPFQFPANTAPGQALVFPYQAAPEFQLSTTPHTLPSPEPTNFSDDEPLPTATSGEPSPLESVISNHSVTLKSYTEFPAVAASGSVPEFAVLLSIRAPPLLDHGSCLARAPIDLVTVLDVSGSMGGSKLSLMKRAVRFVIQSLGSSDRLSLIVFSSTARRIFPLRRMTDQGREDANLMVNSVSANGGTNIVEGLKKGVRVLEERRERNPVASIILLSDGRDTYNLHNNHQPKPRQCQGSTPLESLTDFLSMLPVTICPSNGEARDDARTPTVPVHTFGFGSDHDSASMHAISDASGGTFSFIESIGVVQDAFARCIGGLLSVVAQELKLTVEAVMTGVSIRSIPSGKYTNNITEEGRKGTIEVGDLYADEQKEFLFYISVPADMAETTSLLDVTCSYINTESKETLQVEGERVVIRRPEVLSPEDLIVSLEVDRQKNRLFVAEGIAEAQQLAERGNLQGAQAVLTSRRSTLFASASAQAGDSLCGWLDAELTEIRDRMATMETYEHTGRAYVLSGLSSHSWQRATTRGDSTTQTTTVVAGGTSNSGVIGYDTPSMVSMVSKSQVLSMANHPEHFPRISKSCSLSMKKT